MYWKDYVVPSADDIVNAVQNVFYTVISHAWYSAAAVVGLVLCSWYSPWYSAAAAVVGLILAFRLYCRYTLGMCHCTTDLTVKTVIITGGNTGIGKATAIELARRNAKVIIGCRSIERGSQAVQDITKCTGNKNVTVKQLDLCSFNSVRRFAENVKETEDNLHILINNAGITDSDGKYLLTEDGCEHIMQANHLGHFLLTLLLLDLLKKSAPSRIINVSSVAYSFSKMDLDHLDSGSKRFRPFHTYSDSKLANVLFTREMSRRLAGTGVTVNVLHPGLVKTDISRNLTGVLAFSLKFLFFFFGKTPLEGAQTTLHLALSPKLDSVSGKYFSDCKEEKLKKGALNEKMAKKFWEICENIVGLKMDSKI